MRKYGRVDKNQTDIVDTLRALGVSVQSLASMGDGVPDLLCGLLGLTFLLEVKTETGKLTDDQIEWLALWRGDSVLIIRNTSQAELLVKFIRRHRHLPDQGILEACRLAPKENEA
jgi:hypothetical protein